MKTFSLVLVALAAFLAPPQDPAEEKKRRLAELIAQRARLQEDIDKLVKELAGGERERQNAMIKEVMDRYASDVPPRGQVPGGSFHHSMVSALQKIAAAEEDFKTNDRDANGTNDYWVGDLSGLYRIEVKGEPIKLVELNWTLADTHPILSMIKAGPIPGSPKTKLRAAGVSKPDFGTSFCVVEKFEDQNGKGWKYDVGGGRNPSRFAFCAYPSEYGKTGRFTFIINETNVVYRKDLEGSALGVWPLDPAKAGWEKQE
jgi:Protein of unknown function (DUF2950)